MCQMLLFVQGDAELEAIRQKRMAELNKQYGVSTRLQMPLQGLHQRAAAVCSPMECFDTKGRVPGCGFKNKDPRLPAACRAKYRRAPRNRLPRRRSRGELNS